MYYVNKEIRRFLRLVKFSDRYKYYFFDNFMFIINAYLKAFNKEIKAQNDLENYVGNEDRGTNIKETFEKLQSAIEEKKDCYTINSFQDK